MFIPLDAVVLNWRNEKHLSKLYSTHLRITINRKSKYHRINIPMKVMLKEWAGVEGAWVKPNYPFF